MSTVPSAILRVTMFEFTARSCTKLSILWQCLSWQTAFCHRKQKEETGRFDLTYIRPLEAKSKK
jgi:hypothetical protein